MPDHPDREQLAAFQAGDGDRRQRSDVETHLDGCPSCAEVVASVEQARRRLALLEEPELPASLHDRLLEAVGGDTVQAMPPRPTPWFRRPVAWGAAAALLLAALVVPFLDRSADERTTASGGGSAAEAVQAPGPAGVADLPLLRVPGEVSAAVVRSRIATDPQARQAVESVTPGSRLSGGGSPASPQGQAPPTAAEGTTAQDDSYRAGDTAAPEDRDTAALSACLPAATAAADAATRPLVPAFYVEGTYKGQPATVLVTTSTGQPGRVDLWVFPRGDCAAPPLATERVR